MAHSEHGDFSYRERIVVAPVQWPLGSTTRTPEQSAPKFLHVRMESSMTLTTTTDASNTHVVGSITPFPRRQVREILQRHNATRILVKVGTSSSHTFGIHPLDSVAPWPNDVNHKDDHQDSRLDLGPSGVLVRATFRLPTPFILDGDDDDKNNSNDQVIKAWGKAQFHALLQDLMARRILLAPLFSVSIRRLHRHVMSTWTTTVPDNNNNNNNDKASSLPSSSSSFVTYELVLPMEGAALSSEGMHAFTTALAPCHNQSGIFAWNDPVALSELFVKRHTTARHSWWIQIDQQQHQQQLQKEIATTTTRIIKGLQFQPLLQSPTTSSPPSNKIPIGNRTVALADLFPSSTRHRICPFVQEATLETLVSPMVQILAMEGEGEGEEKESGNEKGSEPMEWHVRELSPKNWKQAWMALTPQQTPLPSLGTKGKIDDKLEMNNDCSKTRQHPQFSVHQALQRPRGVAYSGRLITQVTIRRSQLFSLTDYPVHSHSNHCQVSVSLQWFLPPVVQPTWQSLRVVWEKTDEQVEQELDWRQDLDGRIQWIDTDTHVSRDSIYHLNSMDDATIHFHIPSWNVTTSEALQKLTIYLDYRPAFLSFEHFPGDANRGVEIPPAMASIVETCPLHPALPKSSRQAVAQPPPPILLYAESLLLLPPVPDMSMPFNVLSMTCSLYAFIIGSLLNLLIRKSSERVQQAYDPSKVPPPSKLKQIKGKIQERIAKILRRRGQASESVATITHEVPEEEVSPTKSTEQDTADKEKPEEAAPTLPIKDG